MPRWTRDLLIIPTIVAIVAMLFQFVPEFMLKERKNLQIKLEGPISLTGVNKLLEDSQFKPKYSFEWGGQPETRNSVESETEQKSTADNDVGRQQLRPPTGLRTTLTLDELYAYKLRINNSGDIELRDVFAHVAFLTDDESFIVPAYSHFTEPQSMGDTIEHLDSSDRKNLKFRYESFNPGEQDIITVLASAPSTFRVDLRGSGYTVSSELEYPSGEEENIWFIYMLFAVLGAVISILLGYVINRNKVHKEHKEHG